MDRTELFIGNSWVTPSGSEWLETRSPTTEEVIGRTPRVTTDDVDAAVAAARTAFDDGPWARMDAAERGQYMRKFAGSLMERVDDLIDWQIWEMGSPRAWIAGVTQWLIYSIEKEITTAENFVFEEYRDGIAGKVLVRKEPIGVVATIIPWNAPVANIIGKITVPLLTGSAVVVKPAEECPLSAYLVADAMHEAGLPPGTVSIIPGDRAVGEHLVSHRGTDKVSFTGSTAAGARVGAICGEQIKSATLELGGKSAAIILDDVDLETSLPSIVGESIQNNGQVCHAPTRILAPASRYDEILLALSERIGAMKVGDPYDADTEVGPLVAERQRARVEGYIRSGTDEGARVVVGGGRPAGQKKGWYVEPTLFVDVTPEMKIAQEEIFGPVVALIKYSDTEDAIRIANATEYGLGGAIFTTDVSRAVDVAGRIRTGTCSINDAPAAGGGGPFGGYKRSGLGREFGVEGWEGYLETKAVSLPTSYVPEPRQ